MITPVNNNLIIEPLKHETFLAMEKETFEEVGIVVAKQWWRFWHPKIGKKVWFDSWLASKHPKNETEYYWVVNYKDIKIKGNVPDKISE